jgi:uncharacterized protein (DUF1778 family)
MSVAATRSARATKRRTRRVTSFRIPDAVLDLVDRAAERRHQDRTTFMIAAAVEKASEVLRDQTTFTLADDDFDRFVALLDDPPRANERLKALMRRKAPWEE